MTPEQCYDVYQERHRSLDVEVAFGGAAAIDVEPSRGADMDRELTMLLVGDVFVLRDEL